MCEENLGVTKLVTSTLRCWRVSAKGGAVATPPFGQSDNAVRKVEPFAGSEASLGSSRKLSVWIYGGSF